MGPKGRKSSQVEPEVEDEQSSFDSSDELAARHYPTVNHLQSISRGFADKVGQHYSGAPTGSPAEHTACSSTNNTASQLDQSEAAAKLLACNVMLDGEFYCSGVAASIRSPRRGRQGRYRARHVQGFGFSLFGR